MELQLSGHQVHTSSSLILLSGNLFRDKKRAFNEKSYLFVRAEDQTLLYEETEAEVDSQRGKVEELVTLGRELVKGTHQSLFGTS